MDFEEIRAKADANLGGRLGDVAGGADLVALEPFAKAYLGLLLDIDDALAPAQRVALLADEPLATAVLDGFVAALGRDDLPRPDEIGAALRRDTLEPVGYVVLAGLDRLNSSNADPLRAVPEATLAAALCFQFANTPSHIQPWLAPLLVRRPDLVVAAFSAFWVQLLPAAREHLPGLRMLLATNDARPALQRLLPQLLTAWSGCRAQVLRDLLFAAFRTLDHPVLLKLARDRLADNGELEVRKRVYWLATAFLLDPGAFAAELADYVGRWREKTLPLLDFTVAVLSDAEAGASLGPVALGHLLGIIAPTLRRNEHLTGGLDAASDKVLWLFDRLAEHSDEQARQAVARLRRIRVMRVYADVLDRVAARQAAAHST